MSGRGRPSGILAALVYVFLYSPIVIMALFSFNNAKVIALPFVGFTLKWYQNIANDPLLLESLYNSLVVGLGAVLLAILFGIPAAFAIQRYQFPGREFFRRVVLLPIILPGLITGISLLNFFRLLGMRMSLWTVVLGHGTALISVVVTEVYARLNSMSVSLEEASHDLGADSLYTFRRVILPRILPAVAAAALIAFTLSFDEIPVTFFLTGSANTLPMEIWSRLRRGITPEINAISTLIILFSIASILLSVRFTGRGGHVSDRQAEM